MFSMSTDQLAAFKMATNGTGAMTFCHLILFLIGVCATIWLLLIFIGTMKSNTKPIYESIYEFAFAVGVFTAIGVVIYYT